MRRTALTAALTAGALLVGGGGVALADAPPPTPSAPPASPGSNAAVCGTRIPKILARIDRLTTRINAGGGTRGSTAWLQARENAARATGRSAAADLLAARIADRPHRLDDLAQLKDQVEQVRAKDCPS